MVCTDSKKLDHTEDNVIALNGTEGEHWKIVDKSKNADKSSSGLGPQGLLFSIN